MTIHWDESFIEGQFPISKLSKESYKERKANLGQTLTGLGKWWGRKPLILVRGAILGVLMPTSDDPKKDMEIFLKILTMDKKGLLKRKLKNPTTKEIYALATDSERKKYFEENSTEQKPVFKKGISKKDKEKLIENIFNRMSYDDKLKYCVRPEHIENLDKEDWEEINEHLGTNAYSFQELIQQLGEKKFGRVPKVGDCFCGGGSIPFEASRMGCEVYASDLNPVAGLLTWASLNILSKSDEEIEKLKKFQQKIFEEVEKQVDEWGIESNEKGWRAKYYLYCNETTCPECGAKIPLAPSFVISEKQKTIAVLTYNEDKNAYDIEIKSGVSKDEMKEAKKGTVRNGRLECPHCGMATPISVLRGDKKIDGEVIYGLRIWEKDEFIPRPDDVFRERLYCIGWIDDDGKLTYLAPTDEDLEREEKVIKLLSERFEEWQKLGYIPSSEIEEGDETTRLRKERGWKYWHQLYNPRQLLILGLFAKKIDEMAKNRDEIVIGLLGLRKIVDWNSKLCVWNVGWDKTENTYLNQALNTLFNYGVRTSKSLTTSWCFNINNYNFNSINTVELKDARNITTTCDIWITDPPYADAVNYHELSELFIAWDKKLLKKAFPEWYADSKRALAVRGRGKTFNESMVEIYSNLNKNMPDNGYQVVMFTHQDVKVWAELASILWLSGLQVVSAWNIATETESGGLKSGNYVKGTVLLTLKKRTNTDIIFQDELYDEVKDEVRKQIKSMKDIDDKDDPNFGDSDYLLAAYAASLKVITSYENIEGIDIKQELTREDIENSPITNIINRAVKIAYDCLIPKGFDSMIWKDLKEVERFYIRGLEAESNGSYSLSTYQELAKGFGVKDYKDMLANTKANHARLKTATEYANKGLSKSNSFSETVLRQVLKAIYLSTKEESAMEGRKYLKATYEGKYWDLRSKFIEILEFISRFEHVEHMEHWHTDSHYALILKELIKNDSI